MKEFANPFKNKKIRRIIFVSFAVSQFFAMAAIYELNSSRELELKRAKVQANNLSNLLEEQISGTFKNMDRTLLDIAKTIQRKNYKNDKLKLDQQDLKPIIEEGLTQIPGVIDLFVLDRTGRDVLRTKNGKENHLGDDIFILHKKNASKYESFLSPPVISKITKLGSIVISRQIIDRNNQFAGLVAGVIPLGHFKEIYSRLDIGNEGVITLMSDEERFGTEIPISDFAASVMVNRVKAVHDFARPPLDGLSRFYSVRKVYNSKLAILVGISENESLLAWKNRCLLYLTAFISLWLFEIIYLFNSLKSLQALEENRKMAIHSAQLNSLGEMASGIAHEINNPLTIIHARSTLLKRQIEMGQYDPEAFKEALVKINMTVDRIAKIIRGLKSFSRNADNDVFTKISLKTIIENALSMCAEKFRNKMVLVKIDTIPDFLLECREAQLIQVLINLLNNSYDAVINLDERWVHFSFSLNERGNILLMITDSGKGIPEEVAQNIMQPFFTTKAIGAATGLGLSISKGIIEDHKGKFYLDKNSPNTRFVIELPLHGLLHMHHEIAKNHIYY